MDWVKQVEYWREGAKEDLAVAADLLRSDHRRHALFMAHLSLEKAIKSLVARKEVAPPRMHNLLVLADQAGLTMDEGMREFLAKMNRHQMEGRYPGTLGPAPSRQETEEAIARAGEAFQWLMNL